MNSIEEAIIYATIMHQGKIRKIGGTPFILHPLEVAQIIATMTDDEAVITAGVLHDIVEDTDGTLSEITARFGDRVASLVSSETEIRTPGEDKKLSWKRRKEESLTVLKNSTDIGVKMLWLADKLSNIRSLADNYSEKGDAIWSQMNQDDPKMHHWYYKSIAESLEMDLNRTGAFKEFLKHINFIWPGTFESEKERYKKLRSYSVDGCKVIGQGAKGTVYRYDDELIIKVYNSNNTYKDIERENYLARKAFIAGIPTAISFGIVTVGDRYGSMFELLNSCSVSQLIARDPNRVEFYGKLMAHLAHIIHSTNADGMNLPDYTEEVGNWIDGGIAHVDDKLAQKVHQLVSDMQHPDTMIHGDLHTGNVMIQEGEPILIDMDNLSVCNPIVEISGLYMFYVGFGELNKEVIESFMGFSYETAKEFFSQFMKAYLNTDDEARIQEVTDKASLLTYARLVRRVYKKGSDLSPEDAAARDYYMDKIYMLADKVQDLNI